MPTWTCPACGTGIQHVEGRPDSTYRCPVCRLELVLDRDHDTLVVAPMPGEKTPAKNFPKSPSTVADDRRKTKSTKASRK